MSGRIVFGAESGRICAKCGAPLAFYRNERSRIVPCNPDGSDHWDLCRERRYTEAKEGKHVNNKREEAYYSKRGRFAVRETAKHRRKKLPPCKDCVLPWEEPCAECPGALKKAA